MKLHEVFNNWDHRSVKHLGEDYASGYVNQVPTFDPHWSRVIGTMDTKDVWMSRCWGEHVYVFAFRTSDDLEAYVAITDEEINNAFPLIRAKNVSGQSGLIAALIGFITRKLGYKLIVKQTEMLTDDGIEWLIKFIQHRANGTKDQHGNHVDPIALKQEWEQARSKVARNTVPSNGPTAVIIEDARRYEMWGTGYRKMHELLVFVGDSKLQ